MEFLMTYGWAILVVLVVIGALAYFGVLSPGRLLPDRCQLPPGVSCEDFSLVRTTNTISLIVTNGLGQPMTITSFTGTSPDGSVACANTFGVGGIVIQSEEHGTITSTSSTGLPLNGSKQRLNLNIVYTLPTGLPHTLQGDLYTSVG